jgi:apolipoprotein D and lipocalin family protein
MIKSIIALTLAIVFAGCVSGQKRNTMETVSNVELEKYMGTWYEIARFPHSFERDLVGVTATYRLKNNGNVEVINQGYKLTLDGKPSRAKAFAKIPNSNEPGRLKVYFFWPFGADYLILDLDNNYQWALVGSSSPNYLWILSRSPQMDSNLYNSIVSKAKLLGYNTEKLELVLQKVTE